MNTLHRSASRCSGGTTRERLRGDARNRVAARAAVLITALANEAFRREGDKRRHARSRLGRGVSIDRLRLSLSNPTQLENHEPRQGIQAREALCYRIPPSRRCGILDVAETRGSQKWRPASPTLSENRPLIRLIERGKDSRVDRRRALAFEPLPSCLPPSFAARP